MKTGKELISPTAVIISDIHYSINTYNIADAAVRLAIKKAEELGVPLVVAGDLHDTKAALRGECIKAMIDTFSSTSIPKYVIPGNHCMLNEKGEGHSLEFLRPYATIIDLPSASPVGFLIPYQTSISTLQDILSKIEPGATVICHQGVHGASMGHYTQDKTSISKEAFANFRTVSGHYHTRQTIQCGPVKKRYVGQFDYIGNPYTLNYGECLDPEKGFQILNSDGSMTFVPTNLRKHLVVDRTLSNLYDSIAAGPNDLVKYRLHGIESELVKVKKRDIGNKLLGHCNFIFEKVPTKTETVEIKQENKTDIQLMDQLIDAADESADHKEYMKRLFREV